MSHDKKAAACLSADGECFGDLLEFVFGALISLVDVGMVFSSETSVSGLEFLRSDIARNAEARPA